MRSALKEEIETARSELTELTVESQRLGSALIAGRAAYDEQLGALSAAKCLLE